MYVIEFDADWIDPKGKGTVYVGYTARTPEQRLETHRMGGRTAAAIFKGNRKRRGANRAFARSCRPRSPVTPAHGQATRKR